MAFGRAEPDGTIYLLAPDGDVAVAADSAGDDCDDANSDIYPSAEEIWYDGIDQDCDGNDADQDGDGYNQGDDCDDEDASSYPDNGTLDADCVEIGDVMPIHVVRLGGEHVPAR